MSEELKQKLTEQNLVEIIYKWKHIWMDVKGTDQRDRENYFSRAFGVDANMIYSLARLLQKELGVEQDEKENG